jgi:ribonuclease P protein component
VRDGPRAARGSPSETAGDIKLARKRGLQRLTRREQFTEVLANGRRLAGKRFLLVARLAQESQRARLGIVAARKAIPRAVDRNRSKRLVREAFREFQDELGATDVVVVCRRAARTEGNALVRGELAALFGKLGACKDRR